MMDIGGWISLGFFIAGSIGLVISDRRLTLAKRLFEAATEDRLAVSKAFALAKAGLWEEAQLVLMAAEEAEKKLREDVL